MSAARGLPLLVVPPPGPLAWLFPELLGLEPPVRGEAGAGDVLDLGRAGLSAQALADHVLGLDPAAVTVAAGPRGETCALVLRQLLRPARIEVRVAGAGTSGGSLEEVLAAAALAAGPGACLRAGPEAAGLRPTPLSVAAAAAAAERAARTPGRSAWLLPLPADASLAAHLARALREIGKDPAAFRRACLVPFFLTEPPAESDDVETRLALSWWGVLPGDRYPPEVRAAVRSLQQILHPERCQRFLAYENHALTGFDLYAETLLGRLIGPAPRARPEHTARVVAVCGIDGSGKSSHVAALDGFLRERGLRTRVHKIYRHGVFHDTVTDLARRCAGGKNLHLWRLERIAKVFDSVKYFHSSVRDDLTSHDVLLFDRYTFTHFAAARARYHHDPFAAELLSVYPPPDRVFLLDLPAEAALRRIGTRPERTIDENPYMLARYRAGLLRLAERHRFTVLDADAPFAENQSVIRAGVVDLLAQTERA